MSPNHQFARLAALALGILISSAGLAFDGQTVWMTVERAPVIEDASAHAEHPRAVSDGYGGVIVAWQHEFAGGIRVQRLDHTGAQQWISTGVVLSGTGYAPQIAVHPGGGVVVAWYETELTKTGIYVQHVTAGGSPAWAPGGVQIATTSARPAICATSTAGTFVAWHDSSNDVRVGNINDSGQPTAPGVNGVSLGATGFPAHEIGLVQAGLGSVIAVWQDNSSPGRILAQKVGPGFPWGATPRVVGAPANRHNQIPVADGDGMGGAVVAWHSLPWSGGGVQIRTQRIDDGGTTQWNPGGIVLVDSDDVGGDYNQWILNRSPAIATDGEGGAFVAWDDWRGSSVVTSNSNVFVQRIDLWGSTVWDDNGINPSTDARGPEESAHLVTDRAGGVIVAFEEYFPIVNPNWEVMGARIERLGNFHWRYPAYYDTTSDAISQLDGQVVFDGSGPSPHGAIYVWLDVEEDDIYANKIEVSRPYGDECNADTPWIEPGAHAFNLAGSGADMEASCGGVGADLWLRFVAPADGTLKASTCGTHDSPTEDEGVDTVLSLHSACPAGGENFEIACNDDWFDQCIGSDAGIHRDSYVETPLLKGQDVLIRVSRYASSFNGLLLLNVAFEPTPPPNDDCADALPIAEGSYLGTMIGATTDAGTSCAGSASDVWYRYTAPTSAVHRFFTCETNDMNGVDQGADTVLSIHSACPQPGEVFEITCNNDAAGACETMDQGAAKDSMISYLPVAGEDIWVRVARESTSFDADFFLHVDADAPAAGRVPRDHLFQGEPLRLAKSGAELVLTWGPSCMSSDTDFSVYAGPMSSYGLHEPLTCTTMGLAEYRFIPPSGDTYFVVVPHNGLTEGSYGHQKFGFQPVERPPSPATCYPQNNGDCP